LLAQSDFVALCAQWTPETDKLIGETELRRMKASAYLINVARGELIDQPALITALRQGWIAGAALDVYDGEFTSPPPTELWQLPNVLITPHTGEPLVNMIDWQRGY
jgi:phosphoglycerate dehydrogenase-like enzyme